MLAFWRDRLQGGGALPPRQANRQTLVAALGGFIALAFVAGLAQASGQLLILGSLGASCVMLFGFPDLPFSQPRNAVLGHVLASFIGVACLQAFGAAWWAMPLALALALAAMMALGVTHPPAGSNPIIIFLGQQGWSFLLFPTFAGILGIVLVALIFNNLTRKTPYPKYW